MAKYVAVQKEEHIATLTLTNPPQHTINASGSEELLVALEALVDDDAVRVVILTGGSPDIFVRHYEVGELANSAERLSGSPQPAATPIDRSDPSRPRKVRGLRGAMELLGAMDAVTIAAINGMAMGGGLELALACDFRLARSGNFSLGLPETGVGILPGGGGTQRLARLIGSANALDLILHGALYTPEQALQMGIVSRVFVNDLPNYRREVQEFAATLAVRAPRALANAKRAIREGVEMSLLDGLRHEANLFAELMTTEDAALALRAAFEGNPRPTFRGR